MAPNSNHLIQISIVEEYRIFRTINLDKNDDFVHSTKMFNIVFYNKIYTVKPVDEVTSIEQSPVLKGHLFLSLSLKISYELNLF